MIEDQVVADKDIHIFLSDSRGLNISATSDP
jgi:hypothetical protein